MLGLSKMQRQNIGLNRDNNELSNNPVTVDSEEKITLNGLYDVLIEKEDNVEDLGALVEATRNRLLLNRNLCEDLMCIRTLKTETIGICTDIVVRPDVGLEEILAEIFYQLELYVSPPVNFYTIAELQEKGKTTEQIFEGPLLQHGFIDDEEFQQIQRRCYLKTSDIIQIIMQIEGVLAVSNMLMLSFVELEVGETVPLGYTFF